MRLESGSNPNLEAILMFPTRPGSSKKRDVKTLHDKSTTGMLMKQSLFNLLKHETLDEPKANTWIANAGTFITMKKAVINWCLLPSIMTKHSFSMEVNALPDGLVECSYSRQRLDVPVAVDARYYQKHDLMA